MDRRRESRDTVARVISPPPTYDESANDTALSVHALYGAISENVSEGPESQTSNLPTSRPTSMFTRAWNRVSQPSIQPSSGSQISTASSPDLSRTTSSPQTSSSSQMARPSPVQEEDYFSPLSVVTTIRKGATEDGAFVAEFGHVYLRCPQSN
ncbi:hypothetical protein EIP86_008661 [Pleurotus ostreatoroseus]|nr:hypothetical protein EIP86_008661 [Pleurotus ostreatoroseus]